MRLLLALVLVLCFEPFSTDKNFVNGEFPSPQFLNSSKAKKIEAVSAEPPPHITETEKDPISLDPMPLALPIPNNGKPLLSLVLDDCGGNLKLAKRVASLDLALTWAILPNLSFTKATVNLLRAHSIPFLLHLPMQAYADGNERKEYLIGEGMSEEEVRKTIEEILPDFPSAFGVNNHRGSKATEDPVLMLNVMRVLKKNGLFFLDSSTSSKSIADKKALSEGVHALKNGFFLDNEANLDKIASQFSQAIRLAKRRGSLIAICHLRPVTVEYLEKYAQLPSASRDVELVTLPQMWLHVNALKQAKVTGVLIQ